MRQNIRRFLPFFYVVFLGIFLSCEMNALSASLCSHLQDVKLYLES